MFEVHYVIRNGQLAVVAGSFGCGFRKIQPSIDDRREVVERAERLRRCGRVVEAEKLEERLG